MHEINREGIPQPHIQVTPVFPDIPVKGKSPPVLTALTPPEVIPQFSVEETAACAALTIGGLAKLNARVHLWNRRHTMYSGTMDPHAKRAVVRQLPIHPLVIFQDRDRMREWVASNDQDTLQRGVL